jgi:hypothetical protein
MMKGKSSRSQTPNKMTPLSHPKKKKKSFCPLIMMMVVRRKYNQKLIELEKPPQPKSQ